MNTINILINITFSSSLLGLVVAGPIGLRSVYGPTDPDIEHVAVVVWSLPNIFVENNKPRNLTIRLLSIMFYSQSGSFFFPHGQYVSAPL